MPWEVKISGGISDLVQILWPFFSLVQKNTFSLFMQLETKQESCLNLVPTTVRFNSPLWGAALKLFGGSLGSRTFTFACEVYGKVVFTARGKG